MDRPMSDYCQEDSSGYRQMTPSLSKEELRFNSTNFWECIKYIKKVKLKRIFVLLLNTTPEMCKECGAEIQNGCHPSSRIYQQK